MAYRQFQCWHLQFLATHEVSLGQARHNGVSELRVESAHHPQNLVPRDPKSHLASFKKLIYHPTYFVLFL